MKLDFKAKLVATGPKGAWCFLHFPFDIEKTFGTIQPLWSLSLMIMLFLGVRLIREMLMMPSEHQPI